MFVILDKSCVNMAQHLSNRWELYVRSIIPFMINGHTLCYNVFITETKLSKMDINLTLLQNCKLKTQGAHPKSNMLLVAEYILMQWVKQSSMR